MTKRLALVLVQAALSGGEHESAVFDGACAHQDVPMRFPGLAGEGGRRGQEAGAALGERAIERRKTHVVADREPDAAPWQVAHDCGLAGLVVRRLAIELAI